MPGAMIGQLGVSQVLAAMVSLGWHLPGGWGEGVSPGMKGPLSCAFSRLVQKCV